MESDYKRIRAAGCGRSIEYLHVCHTQTQYKPGSTTLSPGKYESQCGTTYDYISRQSRYTCTQVYKPGTYVTTPATTQSSESCYWTQKCVRSYPKKSSASTPTQAPPVASSMPAAPVAPTTPSKPTETPTEFTLKDLGEVPTVEALLRTWIGKRARFVLADGPLVEGTIRYVRTQRVWLEDDRELDIETMLGGQLVTRR